MTSAFFPLLAGSLLFVDCRELYVVSVAGTILLWLKNPLSEGFSRGDR